MLLGEKLITLLGFLVFLDGHEVHRADFVEPLLQGLDLLRDGLPIRGRARRRHFFRRQHVHFRRAFVGKRDGECISLRTSSRLTWYFCWIRSRRFCTDMVFCASSTSSAPR